MKLTWFLNLDNATRECFENGTWNPKADYTSCKPILENTVSIPIYSIPSTIYTVGYSLSLVALLLALSILLIFR